MVGAISVDGTRPDHLLCGRRFLHTLTFSLSRFTGVLECPKDNISRSANVLTPSIVMSFILFCWLTGINGVEWDAVELPSQFMENWCYHKPTVDQVKKQQQAGLVTGVPA